MPNAGNSGGGGPGGGEGGGIQDDREAAAFSSTFSADTEKSLSPQEEAALILKAATEKGISFIEEARNQGREDLAPFAETGAGVLPGLQELITDPTAQKEFITDNPFFKALADDAERRIFGTKAARGKLGSGGTAEALQNSILLLGEGLVGRNIGQRQTLANMGLSATGGQAQVSSSAGRDISDLITSGASAEAAGVIGTEQARIQSANARRSARSQTVGNIATLGAIALSDVRYKENVQHVKDVDGVPYYFFKYKGETDLRFGTMAQEVQHIPGAVLNIGGKKYVDYGRLH